MCGINLVLNYPVQGEKAIVKMMDATCHRGPDHSSWLATSPGIFVAGNRLKTLDLGEGGNQPITTMDKQGILVWNGALYNYHELKNNLLSKGIVFNSRSDSEVLIHWLKVYGQEGVKELQGMYAFAFVDREKRKIIVGRDPYGKKPLYFHHHQDQWLFSSEARAIASSGLLHQELDVSQYLPYFYSRHTFPDLSFFKGIRQLMAGMVMVFDFEGHTISSVVLEEHQKRIELPSVEEFKGLVLEAVLKHFEADVPVGISLSGGADSSLILLTWYQETGIPLHTFTAVYEKRYQGKFRDSKYASALATKTHCSHHEILVTPDVVLENWEEYISSLDQPVGDSASFLTWLIAKEAKNHVKVMVSGAGADELFGGYDRHRAYRYYLKYPELFRFLARRKWAISFLPRRIRKLLTGITESNEATYLNLSALQTIPANLMGFFLPYFPKEASSYKAALAWDRQYYLIHDILKIHDNANMAHGIEGRAPFLDGSLINLSNSMTEEQHMKLGSKYWIREILRRDGLGEISLRKKLGFGMPLKEWIKSDSVFRKRIFSVVKDFEEKSGPDFPMDMRKLARHPENHIEDSVLQIWNLFIMASWKEKQGL